MVRGSRDLDRGLPVLTVFTIMWCTAICLIINFQSDHSWASVAKWGYFSDSAIFKGAYWALITGAFVHVDPIHLLFNMYWLYYLGGAMERTIGPLRWLVFVLSAAFVSSGLQLLSGSAGIGFSGVGYAMFGFCWLTKGRFPEIARYTNQRTVNLFIGWGLLCIVLTYLKVMNIGNFAHAGGLAFGALVGAWTVMPKRWPFYAAGVLALTAGAVLSLCWNPLSERWVSNQATLAMEREDYAQATKYLQRVVQMGGDKEWAWTNLAEIYGYQEDQTHYREAIERLRELDYDAAKDVTDTYGEPKNK
jgi:membrane associated rhomboid family serine protease